MFKLVSFLVSLVWLQSVAYGASFDCKEANTQVERLICSHKLISFADEQLAEIYSAVLKYNDDKNETLDLKQEQREWLKIREKNCFDFYSCLEVYESRIITLKRYLSFLQIRAEVKQSNNVNQLINSENFRGFIRSYFGKTRGNLLWENELLSNQMIAALGGPPNTIKKGKPIVIGSACRAHSCDEKGYFLYDTDNGKAVFALIHFLNNEGKYSKQPRVAIFFKDVEFFERFRDEVRSWGLAHHPNAIFSFWEGQEDAKLGDLIFKEVSADSLNETHTELSSRQIEIIRIVLNPEGYITEELHSEFWELMPYKLRNDKEALNALVKLINRSFVFALQFNRETWASMKESIKAGRVVKTSRYEYAKNNFYASVPKKEHFIIQKAIENAEEIIKNSAEGKPFQSGRETIYISSELVNQVLDGLDASASRAKRLVHPTWGQRIK